MMDDPIERPAKRRWIRRILSFLASFALAIILLIIGFQIDFAVSAIRSDQLQPPPGVIHIQPEPVLFHPKDGSPPRQPKTYEEFLAAHPNQAAVSLITSVYDEYTSITKNKRVYFGSRKWPEPASPDHDQWLAAHQDLIDRLIALSEMDVPPQITCEQAMAVPNPDYWEIHPNKDRYLSRLSDVLCAEIQRRLGAGDFGGAADALSANENLARFMGEPFPNSQYNALLMREQVYHELTEWIQSGPSPSVARTCRDKLSAVQTPNPRRFFELLYAKKRSRYIEKATMSFGALYSECKADPLFRREPSESEKTIHDALRKLHWPYDTPDQLIAYSADAALFKTNTSGRLTEFEMASAQAFSMFDDYRNQKKLPDSEHRFLMARDFWLSVETPNFLLEQFAFTQTRLNLALAGLDEIIQPGTGAITPTRDDPFAPGTLHRIDTTTQTLIYSLGPDRIDQKCTVNYDKPIISEEEAMEGIMDDPKNLAAEPKSGDIFIRIPQKR